MARLCTVLLDIHSVNIANMFNPLKIKTRIKIGIAIVIALLLSFLFIKPKEKDIPVQPLALKLHVIQQPDNTFEMKDISVVNAYAPDYQTDMQDNFYKIEFTKEAQVLFTGKTVKKSITINEWLYENPKNEVKEEDLGDVTFYLPYYKNATALTFTDDSGNEALYVDLSKRNFVEPEIPQSCGDGVCTDNENLLMCYTDCKYLLPKWLPK